MEISIDCATGEVTEAPAVLPLQPEDIAARRAGMIVSMRQARLALLAAGLLSSVQAAIDGIEEPVARAAAQIDWEYATEVRRLSPLVASLGPALALDDAAIDALFTTAAAIQ